MRLHRCCFLKSCHIRFLLNIDILQDVPLFHQVQHSVKVCLQRWFERLPWHPWKQDIYMSQDVRLLQPSEAACMHYCLHHSHLHIYSTTSHTLSHVLILLRDVSLSSLLLLFVVVLRRGVFESSSFLTCVRII